MNGETKVAIVGGQFGAGRDKPRRNTGGIIYASDQWRALSHITDKGLRGTAIESEYPDPNNVFPIRIMKSVNYGIHRGLDCNVIAYRNPGGAMLGVVLYLHAGGREIGCYAYRSEGELPNTPVMEVADASHVLH